MNGPDLNLLVILDALLAERSVVGAARRLRLRASAMSRALARLRKTTGDPLLVRATRGLVPTPRALELRERVALIVQDAEAVLRPAEVPDLNKLARTFNLRCYEGFAENFGPNLVDRAAKEAPDVRLNFIHTPESKGASIRDTEVDLETGVVANATAFQLRKQTMFRDRFIGVVRMGHPLIRGEITASQYALVRHILVSRPGIDRVPIDIALASAGMKREIAAIVAGFSTALSLARASDLITAVPQRMTVDLRDGMHSFQLPFQVPEIAVSMLWDPGLDADPAHQWLRGLVLDTCRVMSE